MPHAYDGRTRPDSGPFRRPDDYSVAVWLTAPGLKAVKAFETCVAYVEGGVDTRLKAGQAALKRATAAGAMTPGYRYEVDVSEDASDEWETVLTGEAPTKETS